MFATFCFGEIFLQVTKIVWKRNKKKIKNLLFLRQSPARPHLTDCQYQEAEVSEIKQKMYLLNTVKP